MIVSLELLNLLPSGSRVNVETLIKNGIVNRKDAETFGVKVLGNGEIKKKVTVEVPISKSAAKRVEKAGGKIEKLSKRK